MDSNSKSAAAADIIDLDAVEEDAVASSVPVTSETGRNSKFSDVWGHIRETDGKWQCNHCKSSGITQVYIFLFYQIRIFVSLLIVDLD